MQVQAYVIDPSSHTIVTHTFDGSKPELAKLIGTEIGNISGAGLSGGKTPDIFFVAHDPDQSAPWFMIAGMPTPIKGKAVIMGMNENGTVGHMCHGSPRETPTCSLEWAKSNVMWLMEASAEHEVPADAAGFEPSPDNSVEAVMNVVKSLAQFQQDGLVGIDQIKSKNDGQPVDLSALIEGGSFKPVLAKAKSLH